MVALDREKATVRVALRLGEAGLRVALGREKAKLRVALRLGEAGLWVALRSG